MLVITEYRVLNYGVSHALSLNPKAGRRTFSANTDDIGTIDKKLIKQAAEETAPAGYKLFSCEFN
jgi:hypothetical protein